MAEAMDPTVVIIPNPKNLVHVATVALTTLHTDVRLMVKNASIATNKGTFQTIVDLSKEDVHLQTL